MFARVFSIFMCAFVLAGCVTSSPEALFSVPSVPQGQGQKTGQYPTIGEIPKGETAQLSKSEAEAEKAKIAAQVERANAQAGKNSEAAYRAEVEALQNLAQQQKQKRLEEIESRKF